MIKRDRTALAHIYKSDDARAGIAKKFLNIMEQSEVKKPSVKQVVTRSRSKADPEENKSNVDLSNMSEQDDPVIRLKNESFDRCRTRLTQELQDTMRDRTKYDNLASAAHAEWHIPVTTLKKTVQHHGQNSQAHY